MKYILLVILIQLCKTLLHTTNDLNAYRTGQGEVLFSWLTHVGDCGVERNGVNYNTDELQTGHVISKKWNISLFSSIEL